MNNGTIDSLPLSDDSPVHFSLYSMEFFFFIDIWLDLRLEYIQRAALKSLQKTLPPGNDTGSLLLRRF